MLINFSKCLCNHINTASTSNPWEVTVSVDDTTTYTAGGFSLVSQQKACNTAYGGDPTQEAT